MMEARMKNRSGAVAEALEQKKINELRKAEQAALERQKEHDKIREARQKKAYLLETIISSQKLNMKGCYSRPLEHFNKKIHDSQVKNNDLASLLNN